MGRWRGESSGLLILRFAAAVSATPQPVSWLPREASGPAWVTSGPGLSHRRQQPGCPATRKGTKGTFDVQRPSSGHALRPSSRPGEHSRCFPTPCWPSCSQNSPAASTRPPQRTSPSWAGEPWLLSVKDRSGEGEESPLSSASLLVVPT